MSTDPVLWTEPLDQWVEDMTHVRRLLDYASPIIGEHDPYYYSGPERPKGALLLLSGITRQIDDMFIFDAKKADGGLVDAKPRRPRKKRTAKKKSSTGLAPDTPVVPVACLTGRPRGTIIHRQLDQCVKLNFNWDAVRALNTQVRGHAYRGSASVVVHVWR